MIDKHLTFLSSKHAFLTMSQTRRVFLQSSAALAAGAALAAQRTDLNSKLRAAVIGLNGRGQAHIECLQNCSGVEVAVLCDPDLVVLERTAKQFEEKYGAKPVLVQDLREVFDRKDVDVVTIATPNHWHTLAAVWAVQAGKDVYLEKPGSHNLTEGRRLVELDQKYDRIIQHGVQLRSCPALQDAVRLLRGGIIGDVYLGRVLIYKERASIGKRPDSAAPSTLDWNLWQGPAAERPYSERYVHYNWHWDWEYGNGDIGNQGIHETDMCLWGLGLGLPDQVQAMGGRFLWDDDRVTPEVLSCGMLYKDPRKMIEIEVRPWRTNREDGLEVGNVFYGSEGYMTVNWFSEFTTFLGPKREPGPSGKNEDPLQAHFDNFIAAVRSRDKTTLNGPMSTAHTSCGLAHLGNIAYRLGRRLDFDPKQDRFVSDPEADAMLSREYRKPFVVPDQV